MGGTIVVPGSNAFPPTIASPNTFRRKNLKKQLIKNPLAEKEQLQEECLHLKSMVNDLKNENIKLKNQKLYIESELTKAER